jgi:hypothetical protein
MRFVLLATFLLSSALFAGCTTEPAVAPEWVLRTYDVPASQAQELRNFTPVRAVPLLRGETDVWLVP